MPIITRLVKVNEFPALKHAMAASNGRFTANPRQISGTKVYSVRIELPDIVGSYHKFYQVFDSLTKNVVETDSRKWYTKYVNRFKLFVSRFKRQSSRT